MNALHIWGFRDVYSKKEASDTSKVEFTKPDQVTIPQDANKLGLYETDKGLVAAASTAWPTPSTATLSPSRPSG